MISPVLLISYLFILLLITRTTSGNIDFALDEFKPEIKDEIIDPHSFYYNKHTQRLYTQSDLILKENNNDIDDINSHQKVDEVFRDCLNRRLNDIPDELFSRRLINMLLSSANFEENGSFMTGNILIQVSSSELDKLKSFGLGKATIRDVDSFIASIFRAAERNSIVDVFDFIQSFFIYLFMHKEIVLVVAIIFYMTWLLRTSKWNMFKIFQASFLMLFITSFVITYFQLLKDAEIKLTAKQVQFAELPVHCRPHLLKWWEKIWYMYGSPEDCQKYYEAKEENHFLHVTPAVALSHMISTVLLHPAGIFGDAINQFVYQCTKNFWTPLQIILGPLMTIGIIILLVVASVCIAGGSWRWAIGPLSWFSLRGSSHPKKKKKLRSKDDTRRVEVILKVENNSSVEHVQRTAVLPIENNCSNENILISKKAQDEIKSSDINKDSSENSNSSESDHETSDAHISDDCLSKNNSENTCEKKTPKS